MIKNRIGKILLLVLGLMGNSFAVKPVLSPHKSFTPFYMYGKNSAMGTRHTAGLEYNYWLTPYESGYNLGACGFGTRVYYHYYQHENFDAKHAVYLSAMANAVYSFTGFIWLGISISPDIGVGGDGFDFGLSSRVWFNLVGGEWGWTKKTGYKIGLYIFLPIMPDLD